MPVKSISKHGSAAVSILGPDGKALCRPASREILHFDLQYWLALAPAKLLTPQPLYLPLSRLIRWAFEFSVLLCLSIHFAERTPFPPKGVFSHDLALQLNLLQKRA